ncbi:MAG TPA: hypothetical protein VGW37_04310 [Terriglobia bacterium]|nr:hypothetical protein [Terriglobia bacterium]
MPRFAGTILITVLLGMSGSLSAQEIYRLHDPDTLARLSYNTFTTQICLAVALDGSYRMVRSTPDTYDGPQRLQGKLSKKELRQLETRLTAPGFRSLSSNHAGLIRQDAEDFAAEVSIAGNNGEVADRTQRLQWLNADDKSPFPATIEKLVSWLISFQPKDARSFTYAEFPNVCPSIGLSLIQPSVAANQHP